MDTLPPPHDALRRTETALAAMRSASSLAEFSTHWQHLVQSIRRCWSKAETHYLRHPQWAALQKKTMRRIFDDPITGYLWHARDAAGYGLPREAAQPFVPASVTATDLVDRGVTYKPPAPAGQADAMLLDLAERGVAFYRQLLADIEAELK